MFPDLAKAVPQVIGQWPNFGASLVVTSYFIFLVKGAGASGPGGTAEVKIFRVDNPASCLTVNADLRDFGKIFVESFVYDDGEKKWRSYEIFELDYGNNQYKTEASAIRSHLKNESDPFKPFLLVDKNDMATLGRAYYALFNIADVIVTERGDADKSLGGKDSSGWRIYFLVKNQFPLHPAQGGFASLNHTLLARAGQAD
jgi:hypothetical protein